MASDSEINLHVLYSQTLLRLDVLARRVRENPDVDAAVEFARYVIAGPSRVCVQNPQSEPLKVDGAFLRWKAEELQSMCTERYRLNDNQPHVTALQLQSIHEKMDLMAAYFSKLVDGLALGQLAKPAPELTVISGGLADCQVLEGRHATTEIMNHAAR